MESKETNKKKIVTTLKVAKKMTLTLTSQNRCFMIKKILIAFSFLIQLSFSNQEGYVDAESIWPNSNIKVCWEDAGYATEKQWVREAIEDTWESESVVDFTGWGSCPQPADYWTWDWTMFGPVYRHKYTFSGIRINIEDDADQGPHVTGLGTGIKGKKNGMALNFAFNNWGTSCGNFGESYRQFCIEAIAVHEFGHALGMAHEQNRPDTPSDFCTDDPQGSNGNVLIGEWDENSVMNYCNEDWNNNGLLSQGDIETVNWMYPYNMSEPNGVFPSHYSTIYTLYPKLDWQSVDPYVSENVEYTLLFGEDENNLAVISTNISNTSFNDLGNIENLEMNKTYYWKINAIRSQSFQLEILPGWIHPIDDLFYYTRTTTEGNLNTFSIRPPIIQTAYSTLLLN